MTAMMPQKNLQEAIRAGYVLEPDEPTDPYRCTLCDKELKSKQTIKAHLNSKQHLSKLPDRGAKMPQEKLHESIATGHVTEPDEPSDPYYCALCEKELKSKQTIKKHLDSKQHQTNVEINQAQKVPREKLKLAIQKGDVIEPENPDDSYHCVLCEKDLKSIQTIKKHLESLQHTQKELLRKKKPVSNNSSGEKSDTSGYGRDKSRYESEISDEERQSYGNVNDTSDEERPSYGNENDTSDEERQSYGNENNTSDEERQSYGNKNDTSDEERPSYSNKNDTSDEERPSYSNDEERQISGYENDTSDEERQDSAHENYNSDEETNSLNRQTKT